MSRYEIRLITEVEKHDKLVSECKSPTAKMIEDIRHKLAITNIQREELEL